MTERPAMLRPADLSLRQREIAVLIALGMRPKTIAVELELSHITVRRHIGRIIERMGGENGKDTLVRIAVWWLRREDTKDRAA